MDLDKLFPHVGFDDVYGQLLATEKECDVADQFVDLLRTNGMSYISAQNALCAAAEKIQRVSLAANDSNTFYADKKPVPPNS